MVKFDSYIVGKKQMIKPLIRKNWHGLGEAKLSITFQGIKMIRQIETDDFIYTRTDRIGEENNMAWHDMEWRALAWFYLETQNDI